MKKLKYKIGPFEKIVDQIRGVFNFGVRFGGPVPPHQKSVATPMAFTLSCNATPSRYTIPHWRCFAISAAQYSCSQILRHL